MERRTELSTLDYRSKCCNAPVVVQGFTTTWYECLNCHKACTRQIGKEETYKFSR